MESPIARLVIKDLIEGDAAKKEVRILKEVIIVQNEKIGVKDLIITTQAEQLVNFGTIVKLSDSQKKIQEQAIKELEVALKSQKRKTFLYKLTTGAGVIASFLLLTR